MTCHRFRIAETEGKERRRVAALQIRSNAATTTIHFGFSRLGRGIDSLELSFPAGQASTTKRQRECERSTVAARFATANIATHGTINPQFDAFNREVSAIASARGRQYSAAKTSYRYSLVRSNV